MKNIFSSIEIYIDVKEVGSGLYFKSKLAFFFFVVSYSFTKISQNRNGSKGNVQFAKKKHEKNIGKPNIFIIFIYCFLGVFWVEPRALNMVGKCSTTELYLFCFSLF